MHGISTLIAPASRLAEWPEVRTTVCRQSARAPLPPCRGDCPPPLEVCTRLGRGRGLAFVLGREALPAKSTCRPLASAIPVEVVMPHEDGQPITRAGAEQIPL